MYGMARFSWQQLRRFVYDNLHNDDYKSKVSNCINYLLIILIVGNVAAVLLESINEIYKLYKPYFDLFENISIVIFSGEYLLRFWSVIEEDREEAAERFQKQSSLTLRLTSLEKGLLRKGRPFYLEPEKTP